MRLPLPLHSASLGSIVGLLALAACASARPVTVSKSAPATALDCALRTATDSGFTPMGGGVASGYMIFDRPHGYTGGEAGKETAARVASMGMIGSGHIATDRISVTGAGGSLRLVLTSMKKNGKTVDPSPAVRAVAQAILTTCAP